MPTKTKTFNLAGVDLVVNRIVTGATAVSQGNIAVADAIDAGHISSRRNIIAQTGASLTLTPAESGSLITLSKVDGITVTLPTLSAANVGIWYDFVVRTSVTSVGYKWATGAQGVDWFVGGLVTADADGTTESGFIVAGNGTSHDNILMNGTTTGGLIGTQMRLTAVSTTLWQVEGVMAASGDTATPFATS